MLPKTFDPATTEPRLYALWEASGAFTPESALARDSQARPFCMVIPPPNVTGSLHIGHALNATLQDVLARYHRMKGEAVLWLPGTDHAGIATQMVVERRLAAEGGPGRRDLGREAFLERVWSWKAESGGAITDQLRRLGASCDWSRERFTLDDGLSAAVRKVFVRLHDEGLLYRAKRLVNWDPQLQTAISDLEVETREVPGKMWHFAYPLEGEPVGGVAEIVIATTRPETMLADGAVAVHPDDPRYRNLVGRFVRLPIADRLIPIIADPYPDPEKGSGAVKITGAHDFNDFEVARRHDLPLISIFDSRARMAGPVPERYLGRDRFDARQAVVAEITALGLLREIEDRVIAQPHGDRSGVVIEPYLTDQWFVDASALAGPAIAAVESGRTVFEPEHWSKTYFEWMRNIEPWCVSRQLWWGHRIPAWYGPEGSIFVAEDAAQAQAQAQSQFGPDVELRQDEDVLDTWFSSALWPFSTLGWPEPTDDLARYYPTQTLVTGFDIIFFWVARMMMMGIHFQDGRVPFDRVVINGLVRDEHGQKMSKSKGNVVDPLEVVDDLGCDALRFSLAILSGSRDIKLSRSRIEGYRNFGTKLWNAVRFCQINGCVPGPGFDPQRVRHPLNRWVRGEVVKAAAEITAGLEGARFADAAQSLYRLVWNTVCDWYIEFAKPLLAGDDVAAKVETQAMAAWTLDATMRLLHPFSPFITEALWEETAPVGGRADLLIRSRWPTLPFDLLDADASAAMDFVVRVVSAGRSLRAELNLPSGARPDLFVVMADEGAGTALESVAPLIASTLRIGAIRFGPAPSGSAPFVVDATAFALTLAGVLDVAAEAERLERDLAGFAADADRLERKLANAEFVARAKPQVVEDTRAKLVEAQDAQEKLRLAADRLRALA